MEAKQIYRLKVDSSGRIVLPADTRARNHIEEGDTLVVIEDRAGTAHQNARTVTNGSAGTFR